MKRRKYIFILLALLLIFTSCKKETQLDGDLWVGTTRVMDHNIPFPFLIERTGDGLLLIDHKNQILDNSIETQSDYSYGDTIAMQEHQFIVIKDFPQMMLFDIKDSVNFPYLHPIYAANFTKAAHSQPIELSSFLNNLEGKNYESEVISAHFATPNRDLKVVKNLKFSEGNLETSFSYYYQDELVFSEKEHSNYDIFERKGKVFLSEGQDKANSVHLYQVSEVEKQSFSLRSFRNNEEVIERFEVSEATEKPSDFRIFERCMEGQPGEYYHDNLTYRKGNKYLIRRVSENAPVASGDGYITVHFTINCTGEMGHLGLEQMDREFQSTSFEPALVKHLISEVMDLKDWPEIKAGRSYKDIHSFLMFRIKNGKITDLCP